MAIYIVAPLPFTTLTKNETVAIFQVKRQFSFCVFVFFWFLLFLNCGSTFHFTNTPVANDAAWA